jgi:hypothetical protein
VTELETAWLKESEAKTALKNCSSNLFLSLCPGLRIRIRIGSGFNRVSVSGSGFGIRLRIQEGKNGRAKMTHKSRKKFVKVHVLKCWMASLEMKSCNLDILYGGLGIGKLQFLIKKKI